MAVEQERARFARDLHDLLGHSLTVITVKSELAGRLMARDPGRAAAEVADIERLAREALADVRATVAGYREVTLAGGALLGPQRARRRRRRRRAARRGRRRAGRAARAVRLGAARGRDQRRAALRRAAGAAGVGVGRQTVEIVDDGAGWPRRLPTAAGCAGCANGWPRRAAGSTPVRSTPAGSACTPRCPHHACTREAAGSPRGDPRDDPAAARRRPGPGPRRAGRAAVAGARPRGRRRGRPRRRGACRRPREVRPGRRAARHRDARPGRHRRRGGAARGRCPAAGCWWSRPSAGPATCAGRWRPARSGSSSRTRRPSSSPTRSGGCTPACGWSTRRWPPRRWPPASRR